MKWSEHETQNHSDRNNKDEYVANSLEYISLQMLKESMGVKQAKSIISMDER